METKLHHFIHKLKPHLREALLLRQPGDCNMAASFAKPKESTIQTNYDELQSQQINSSGQVSNVGYNDPVQMSKEVAKLKAEIF